MRRFLIYIIISALTIQSSAPSYALRPLSSVKNVTELERELQKDYRLDEAAAPSWVEEFVPNVRDYTAVSYHMEAGLDIKILDAIVEAYGRDRGRAASQVTLTGGLGALIHDLVCALQKNGFDTVSMNPLWNDIKGIRDSLSSLPLPAGFKTTGDLLRYALQNYKRDDLGLRIKFQPERIQEFINNTRSQRAREAVQHEIFFDVYIIKSTHGQAQLVYLDAYYLDGENKVYIFNQVYPDEPDRDLRAVHMAVYNIASQVVLNTMRDKHEIKEKTFAIENEVFVGVPKDPGVTDGKFDINHTTWEHGLYHPPWYCFRLLGYDEPLREVLIHNGYINIAEYIGLSADVIAGVSVYEHTPVLQREIFPCYQHRIAYKKGGGLRNTNGVLFDQWQGLAVRALIDTYKKRLGINPATEDLELYNLLDQPTNAAIKKEFMDRFEFIKALYMLDLLIMLKETQDAELGGGRWLDEILKDTPYIKDVYKTRREYFELVWRGLKGDVSAWGTLDTGFSQLRDILFKNPVASNLRRQVPYKGPDKFREMFMKIEQHTIAIDKVKRCISAGLAKNVREVEEMAAQDPEIAEDLEVLKAGLRGLIEQFQRFEPSEADVRAFKSSGVHMLIGGRIFDNEALGLYNQLKDMVRRLGLQDNIAFVNEYNFYDAPLIFRGVSATIMIADEFVEASATSMMKGLTNGAILICAWAGAMPELFTIIDTTTGKMINPLQDNISYDDVEKGLESKRYKIVNGFLVKYLLRVANESRRRPDAKSLLHALESLGIEFKKEDASSRRDLVYEALKSSHLVDIERGQARAHIVIISDAIDQKEDFNKMVNSLRQSGADKIIPTLTIDHPFYWNWKPQGADGATENFYCGGDRERDLLSFLDSFRKVRAKPGSYWSFCFHCSSAHPEGDVLRHMKRFFENQPLLEPLKKKIDGYIKHIATLNNDSSGIAQKAKLTLEIIDYVDRVIRALIEKDKDFYEGVTIIRNQQKPAAQSSMVPLKVISQISAAA